MAGMAKSDLPSERYDVCATLTTRRKVVRLDGSFSAPEQKEIRKAVDLPLIVDENCVVQFEDQYFELDKEGLYRFVNWGKVRYDHPLGKPEIIDSRKSCTAVIQHKKDILSLLGSLAVLTVHGHTHDNASHEERLARMKLGGVALTCGSIANLTVTLLTEMGWKARVVQCCRTEGVYDTYNCGHLLCEFFWPKCNKWVLADVDTHQMFVKNGKYLNMAEVKELTDGRKPISLEPLTVPGLGLLDTAEVVTSDFTGMSLFDHVLLDTDLLKEWYRQMFAAVSLADEWMVYCPDPKGRERVKRYYPFANFLDRNEWYERYYGDGV